MEELVRYIASTLVAPVQAASDVFQQVVVVKMAATWRICHAQT